MQVELWKGDKNFTVLSLVGTIDPLFHYTVLSFLLAVNYSDIGVSKRLVQWCRAGATSGSVAAMSACVVYCTDESVWKVFTKTIGVKQLRIREVSIVVCNCVNI